MSLMISICASAYVLNQLIRLDMLLSLGLGQLGIAIDTALYGLVSTFSAAIIIPIATFLASALKETGYTIDTEVIFKKVSLFKPFAVLSVVNLLCLLGNLKAISLILCVIILILCIEVINRTYKWITSR